jgi:nicotinamidase-related amidase
MRNPTDVTASDVQILFADLQPQIVRRNKTNDPKTIGRTAVALARIAKIFELPVTVTVVQSGEGPLELIPELAAELSDVPLLRRMGPNPFLDEKTKAALSASSRKTLVIAGVATEIVVLHAATTAVTQGYRVLIPVDACGGLSERTEAAAMRQIEAFGGEFTALMTLATSMATDFTTEQGKQVMQVFRKLREG